MKKLLLFISLFPMIASAQTFTNQNPTIIPGDASELRIPVVVSGLPMVMDTSFGLAAVCFDIIHTADVNLRIALESPSGNKIILIDQKGSGGDNFTNTCMTEYAAMHINSGTAPFSGQFIPANSLNLLNDGSDPNGTWYFCITDLFIPRDSGTFQSVLINFSVNPPHDPGTVTGPCSETNAAACKCPDLTSVDCDLLPDITASKKSIIDDHIENPGHIMVGVATPNIGWGPLEIHGTQNCYCDTVPVACNNTPCPNGSMPSQLVNQRVYHKAGGSMNFYDRPAGTMSYHPLHNHIHVDNWLYYTLRTWSPDPDPRNWPIVGTGTKMSFCLVNLSDCDSWLGDCVDTAGNILTKADLPNSDFGNVSGCTTDQGIYVGNIDEYNSGLNGMGIIIPDACNDTYYIVAVVDPLNNFVETNETNNWAVVPITLTQQATGSLPAGGFTYSVSGNQVDVMSNAMTPDSCTWNWGDGITETVISNQSSHTYSNPGTYVVFHYAYNHCGPTVSADTIHLLASAIPESEITLSELKVFPNPTRGNTSIEYTLINSCTTEINLFDAIGKSVKCVINTNQSPGKYRMNINPSMDNLPAGTYTLRFTAGGTVRYVKIVFI